jgi:hypothetical protein
MSAKEFLKQRLKFPRKVKSKPKRKIAAALESIKTFFVLLKPRIFPLLPSDLYPGEIPKSSFH